MTEKTEVMMYVANRNMADIYLLMKDAKKAIETLKLAVEIGKKTFGESHPGFKEDIELLNKLENPPPAN